MVYRLLLATIEALGRAMNSTTKVNRGIGGALTEPVSIGNRASDLGYL